MIAFAASTDRTGSPRPEFELSFDPLRLVRRRSNATRKHVINGNSRRIGSHDANLSGGDNQTTVAPIECRRLMRRVNNFVRPQQKDGKALVAILVTERQLVCGDFVEHAL